MDFLIVTALIGLVVAAWVVVVRIRSKYATYEEMTEWRPRPRRGRRRRRRSSHH